MCGFAGFWQRSGATPNELRSTAREMADALRHRGPDDGGTWCDAAHGFALGHRRLSILDLSAGGHQPMQSHCGRYVIAYNGEVYNFRELRADLEATGELFRSDCDTEVILAAIARWGLDDALARFVGMFAFAIWDRQSADLVLVRDRLGIKPLYWGMVNGTVLFGSELKALRCHEAFRSEINRDSLALLLRHKYVPDPHCIYEGFEKLEPGRMAAFPRRGVPRLRTWWSARQVASTGRRNLLSIAPAQAADRLDGLLRDAVRQRMVADVPLGAFLSGGVDSSLVVALMQAQSGAPVRTFSIGFDDDRYDEAHYAAQVAEHLGTDHHELYVRPGEAHALLTDLSQHWDEPFADSSQIPTLIVSRLARGHVTASLSGDGGDELFGGYARYVLAQRIARIAAVLPPGMRPLLRLLPGSKPKRLAELLRNRDAQDIYHGLISDWSEPSGVVPGSREPRSVLRDATLRNDLPQLADRMMYLDTVTYLPGDILTKVDRASMAVGLEARVPLLDHRVYEFAWRLPREERQGKAILRRILSRYVPADLFERPKKGFGVPLGSWMRGPLRPWVEGLLEERCLRDGGMLDPVPVHRRWADHLAGHRDWSASLWSVLQFQAWFEEQKERSCGSGRKSSSTSTMMRTS